jgi:hypothetical protein
MTKLRSPFDAVVSDLLPQAEFGADAAAQLLTHAAKYLRKRERMPDELADYVADAFMRAARKPADTRAKRLTDWLNLTANNRRKANVPFAVAVEVVKRNPGASQNELARKLAKETGCKPTAARKPIKQALAFLQEAGR